MADTATFRVGRDEIPISSENPLPVAGIVQPGNTPNTTPWLVTPKKSDTGAQSIVPSSASPVTILAANAARLGAAIFNDSTAVLYLLLSSQTVSATLYTVQVGGNGYYEVPSNYTGIIKGIWSSATGNARVTELS